MSLEQSLATAFLEEHPQASARALERMSVDERSAVVGALTAAAANAVAEMLPAAAADCLARLSPDGAAGLLDRLQLDTAVAILRYLPGSAAEAVTAELAPEKAEAVRRGLQYPEGTAGALMDPAILALPREISVTEARLRLRKSARGLLHYLYIVDRTRRLVGVLDIPELMKARARESLESVMHAEVDHLPAWTPAAAIGRHPGWRSFHALPVTDEEGRLVGAIRYQTLRRLERDREAPGGGPAGSATAVALGELFGLGVAGLVEGVASAAVSGQARALRGRREGKREDPA